MPYAISISGQMTPIPAGQPFTTVQLRVEPDEAAHYGVPAGTVIDQEVNHPWNALDRFSDADRARFLIQTVAPTLADAKAQQLAAAAAQYDVHRQSPMPWNFGSVQAKDDAGLSQGAAGVQTLQMRNTAQQDDVKNWLAAAQGAAAMVSAGAGASLLPLKTTANLWVQTTAAEVLQALVTGDGTQTPALARGQAMLAAYGVLKHQITASATAAAALAIDVTAGWPA